jgi:hypothetical protein
MIQDSKHPRVRHVKASTWIPENEMQMIERLRGDISTSLWIKRAIRKALLEGERFPANSPQPAASNTNHPGTNQEVRYCDC